MVNRLLLLRVVLHPQRIRLAALALTNTANTWPPVDAMDQAAVSLPLGVTIENPTSTVPPISGVVGSRLWTQSDSERSARYCWASESVLATMGLRQKGWT